MVEQQSQEQRSARKHLKCAFWVTIYLAWAGKIIHDLSRSDGDSFGTGIGAFMLLFMVPALLWLMVDLIEDAIRSARDE